MIELQNVTKIYPGGDSPTVVLDHLTFTFGRAESVGILGRNGAGKSTLLRILGGAELPDVGRVVRKGRISWPIGFDGGFNGSLTAEENCRFVARIYHADVKRVVDFTRAFADIGKHFARPVRTYSSGMRARVAFGLSMAIDFDMFLVDEVTSVGDSRFQERCQRAFAERQGRSGVIMVSHDFGTLRQYCTRFAVLDSGKLTAFDDIDAAIEMYERVS